MLQLIWITLGAWQVLTTLASGLATMELICKGIYNLPQHMNEFVIMCGCFHVFKFNFVFAVRRAGWRMRPSILCCLPNCWASDGPLKSWRNWPAVIFCGWWVKWKPYVIKCAKGVFYHTKTSSPIAMMIHSIAQPVKFLSSIQMFSTWLSRRE